ncbi:MAG: tetratricopeptide repeat protein [Proteobacteria bacterium]|nr:tetratricopeptide repeat protein [Pseudomonadota bacterium]
MSIIKKLFKVFRDDDYEDGIRLYNSHLYREAIEKFEAVIVRKTSLASLHHNLAQFYCSYAHRNLGIMLFVVGNYAGALEEFQKALEDCQNPHELYHLMGICQNNLGHYENAVQTFSTILKTDPESLPTKLRLGIALHNMKMWDKSVALYFTILAQKPKYADVHFRLGLALLGQGKAEPAAEAFHSAITLNPNYIEAHIKLGLTQAYMGDYDGALASFSSILARQPAFADIYYAMGIAHAGSGSIKDAQAAFVKALEINPAYKDAKIKLGILHCHQGDYEKAAACLREAGQIDPDDKNLQLAAAAVASIMARPDGKKNIPEELTRLFGGGKPLDEAIREFNTHLKIKPDLSAVLAIIKEFSQEDAALCEMLIPVVHDYIKEQPNYPDTHFTLGSIYLKLNKLARAEESFREALLINPEYLKARVNLFTTLKLMGKNREAAEQGALIIGKNLSYPDVYYDMAEVLMALDRPDEAAVQIEEALRLRPHYSKAHYLKAGILAGSGMHDEAIRAFEACLASYPPADLGDKAREALNAFKQTP